MSGRLTYLTLSAKNLSEAGEFYGTVFGWVAAQQKDVALFFELPNLTVALFERSAFEQFVGIAPSESASSMTSWNVPAKAEVNALMERARTAGANILREPLTLSWGGWAGIFTTPDGHLWEIVWNPRG